MTWRKCFDRMIELNAFADGELGLDESAKKPEPVRQARPEPEPTFDEVLDAHSTLDRQDNEIIKHFAMLQNQTEVLSMFRQWERLLYETWGFRFTAAQIEAVKNWFLKWNRSYLRHESWNECRRGLVKAGIFPSNMLLPDEKLAQAIEDSETSMGDYSERREVAHRARLVRGGR